MNHKILSHLKTAAIAIMAMTAMISSATAEAREIESVPGQYVVQLKRERSHYDTRALEKQLRGRIIDQIRTDMILVQRELGEPAEQAIESLRGVSAVKLVDPNFIYKKVRVPNDPDYGKLWGISNQGALDAEGTRGLKGVDVGAERAWDITTGSKNVVVAIIDTGVDFKIPDLSSNAWTNEKELAGQPGVDDDGNGFVDDIHGFDFSSNRGDSTDDNGHGSHCAGTIGASGNDGRGVVGVSWEVSIMAVKFLDAAGSGTLANAVKAIDYARIMGAKIMSNSWGGGGYSGILEKAIEDARAADILFIAAAGNDGGDNDKYATYPASYPTENIVSVAAVDNRGALAYFSNYGLTSVDVAAPGVNVFSTVPGGFDTYSGTSMATPHVSGVAALIMADQPNLSYVELKRRILDYARPIRSLQGKIKTGAMVDAYYSLVERQPPADPNDPAVWANSNAYQLSTPHPYTAKFSQTYRVQVPGAKRVSVRFSKFETESGYDRVQFFNAAGESLGLWSGKRDGQYAPIADGDTLVIKFTSDETVNGYGFDVDTVVFE